MIKVPLQAILYQPENESLGLYSCDCGEVFFSNPCDWIENTDLVGNVLVAMCPECGNKESYD